MCFGLLIWSLKWPCGRGFKAIAVEHLTIFLSLHHSKIKSGLIKAPLLLMQSKKLYPPSIMFHPPSPTVMASQIGLVWGGWGLLGSCCHLIWGLGELQSVNLARLKRLAETHFIFMWSHGPATASESQPFYTRETIIIHYHQVWMPLISCVDRRTKLLFHGRYRKRQNCNHI